MKSKIIYNKNNILSSIKNYLINTKIITLLNSIKLRVIIFYIQHYFFFSLSLSV